jgi:murein DD-endopeptidase MepM/ murein hydrolase activator NlpD
LTGRALLAAGLIVLLLPTVATAAPARRGKPRAKPPVERETEKAEPTPPAKAPTVLEHLVQKGETLSAIARKYKVTVSSLVIANRLKGPRAKLAIGQRLVIKRPGALPAVRTVRVPLDERMPVSLVLSVPDFDDAPSFQWPVSGAVSSTFGRRNRSWHRGIDIRAAAGTPITAAAAGVVVASGFEPRYGQMVKIEHDGGFVTVYAHNERNLVEAGEDVAMGQVIALVGRTGRATGDHVHFEVRYDGRVYNPLYLLPLPPRAVAVELGVSDEHDDDDE